METLRTESGYLELVNGTPYCWIKTGEQSRQMNTWQLPDRVAPWETYHVKIKWSDSIFNRSKSYGDTAYTLKDLPNSSLRFRGDSKGGYAIRAWVSLPARDGKRRKAGAVELGWRSAENVSFVLSGDAERGYVMTGDNMSDWLAAALPELGGKRLGELCLVGSHDAGMCKRSHRTPGVSNRDTLTQSVSLLEQLRLGVQYLDIRPVLFKGKFYAGHFGSVGPAEMGATGMSMEKIISDINQFTSERAGLVVLNLSHDMRFDGMRRTDDLSGDDWKRLLEQLTQLYARVMRPQDTDFTRMTLRELIGGGPAVLVICEDLNEIPEDYRDRGFYLYENFRVYNSYSNTNRLEEMVRDQLDKLAKIPPGRYFLLSWTLTESPADVLNPRQSILKLADQANQCLEQEVYPAARGTAYPNILYTDNIKDTNAAVLAMALNRKRHGARLTDDREEKTDGNHG